jgi:hypothetical protein
VRCCRYVSCIRHTDRNKRFYRKGLGRVVRVPLDVVCHNQPGLTQEAFSQEGGALADIYIA